MAAAPAPRCFLVVAACLLVTGFAMVIAPKPPLTPLERALKFNAAGARVQQEESDVRVLVRPSGARVRLQCAAKSSKLTWTKDGMAVGCAAGGCRATLRFANVTRRDTGMYQCWRPRGRLVPPSFRLKITGHVGSGRPRLVGPYPSNTSVAAGAAASLRCTVHSALPPNIQWLRRMEHSEGPAVAANAVLNKTIQYEGDTYEVLSSSGEAALANHSYLSKLLLPHTTEDDTGFYVCLATNNHGFRYRGTHLTVLPRSPAGVLVPKGLLHVEVALILLVVLLLASPVMALAYLAYSHRKGLLARKQPASTAL